MDDALLTVARYEWRMDALLGRCRLESCGIRTHLADQWTTSICWHYTKALGGIRLQVNSEDAEDAVAVLQEPPQEVEEPVATKGELQADRLLRAAVFGTVAFPVMIYALWLLLNAVFLGGPWIKRERRQIFKAAGIVVPLALILVAAGASFGLSYGFGK